MRSLVVWSFLAVGFVENLKSVPGYSFQRRGKRIIDGVPVEQNNYYYSGIDWYVDLIDGHDCAGPGGWPHHCAKPENNKCGGSLLTPSIVQTSCECLVAFIGPRQMNFTTPCLLGSWENMYLAFVAAKAVESQTEGYLTMKFYVHEKCGKLAVDPHYLTTHDFGFAKLQKEVKQTGRLIPVKYVPIYAMKNLAALYSYNVNNGVTCLTLGYGNHKLNSDGLIDPEKSATLLHSWVIIYEYVRCYYLTGMNKDTVNYLEVATWVCLTRIPNDKQRSFLAPGDGGGPLTCNNHYFGVAGEHHRVLNLEFSLQVASAIAFTPYQNAIEFRKEFESNLVLQIRDPKFHPTFRTMYPLAERGFIQLKNQASLIGSRFCLNFSVALYIILNEGLSRK